MSSVFEPIPSDYQYVHKKPSSVSTASTIVNLGNLSPREDFNEENMESSANFDDLKKSNGSATTITINTGSANSLPPPLLPAGTKLPDDDISSVETRNSRQSFTTLSPIPLKATNNSIIISTNDSPLDFYSNDRQIFNHTHLPVPRGYYHYLLY